MTTIKRILSLLALLVPMVAGAQPEPYAVYNHDYTVLTFYYDDQKAERKGMNVGPFSGPLDISWYDVDEPSDIRSIVFDDSFANCTTLTSTACWFYNQRALISITGINNLKTDNVTDMSSMFDGCSNLWSLDLSGFKTDKVTDMSYMFSDCSSLTNLDLKGFKTDKVTSMEGMFYYCSSLRSLDVSGFKTDNVTNLLQMFADCWFLTNLDLKGFKTDKVTDMWGMFYECFRLTTIYAGDGWSTAKVQYGDDMFVGCTSLVGGAGTRYDESHTDQTYARIDGGSNRLGYFTRSGEEPWPADNPEPYAVLSDNNTVLTFYYDVRKAARNGIAVIQDNIDYNLFGYIQKENITKVVFDASFANYTELTTTANLFHNYTKLSEIIGIENLNTENVTNMGQMFCGCRSLTSLDLSGFKTDKVTNMNHMFECCSGLTTIYAGDGWSTAKLQESFHMFADCTNLVGGAGTRYDESHTDQTYARIDGRSNRLGYFTAKEEGNGINNVEAKADKDVWYDMNGRKLQGVPAMKGVYIKSGKKVVLK